MTSDQFGIVSRRGFVAAGLCGAAGVALASRPACARSVDEEALPGFPHQDPKLVKEVVRLSHFNLDAVRDLVTARPELAKASYDWGFGDWESALGAASHTGQQAIAQLLIEHGARPNLFTHTMMGNLKAVRAMIEAQPGVQRVPGPHGITLLQHAVNGGDEAKAVRDYLEQLGDADKQPRDEPLPGKIMLACIGTYVLDDDSGTTLEILASRGRLAVTHASIPSRPLFHLGKYEFHPTGAPGYRFIFEIRKDKAHRLTLNDGGRAVTARPKE